MNGGSKIIDLHVSDVEYAAADEPLQLTEPYEGEVFDEAEELEERSGATKWRIFAAIAVLAAVAWIGFFAWYAWPAM